MRQGYIDAVAEATDRAVNAGFILTPDAERIRAAASLQWDALEIDQWGVYWQLKRFLFDKSKRIYTKNKARIAGR